MIVPLFLESKAEATLAKEIASVLDDYGVKHAFHIVSAGKSPQTLLELVKEYSEKKESIALVALGRGVTGLAGLMSGATHLPVVACLGAEEGRPSSPEDLPVLFVDGAKNTGQAVVRILGLCDKDLSKKIRNHVKVVQHGFSSNPVELD